MQIRRDDHVCTSEIIEVHIVTGFAVALLMKWAVELALHLTGAVIGLLILLVVGFFVYALFTQRWTDLLILGIIFAGIVAVLFLCVLLQETCDSLREKIRAL